MWVESRKEDGGKQSVGVMNTISTQIPTDGRPERSVRVGEQSSSAQKREGRRPLDENLPSKKQRHKTIKIDSQHG